MFFENSMSSSTLCFLFVSSSRNLLIELFVFNTHGVLDIFTALYPNWLYCQ